MPQSAGRAAAARGVAIVTGASRGIGAACAVHLARAGYDVAVTARTLADGEQREHSSTVHASDTRPVPGSLRSTAALVEAEGREALALPSNLLDHHSLEALATGVLDRWGRIDVVVHNGRYIGPGHMDVFLDTPIELLQRQLEANVIGPLVLTRAVLPAMLEAGSGTIIDISSAVAYADPLRPAGGGGWGLGYGMSKAAFHRVAGILNAELAEKGLRCFNVQPGVIDTERGALDEGRYGFGGWGAPPAVVGAVVAWLVTEPGAGAMLGTTVEAQFVCHRLGLLPGWPGPGVNRTALRYDSSAEQLRKLEESLAAAATTAADGHRPQAGD